MITCKSIFLIGYIAVVAFPSEAQYQYYGLGSLQPLYTENTYQKRMDIALPGHIRIMPEQGQIRYIIGNHLATTRSVLTADNVIQLAADYDPYGNINKDITTVQKEQCAYNSTYSWNTYTNTYKTPTREYDPLSGRFLSPDPVKQNSCLYTYTAGNPLNYTDKSGTIIRLVWEEPGEGKTRFIKKMFPYQLPAPDREILPSHAPEGIRSVITILDHLHQTGAGSIVFEAGSAPVNIIARMTQDQERYVRIGVFNGPYGENQAYTDDGFLPGSEDLYGAAIEFRIQAVAFKKDPHLPMTAANTGRHSAALVLLHELLHAYNVNYDYEQYNLRRRNQYDDFGHNEEEDYVTGLTNQGAEKLQQDIRFFYGGTEPYSAESPVSAIPRMTPQEAGAAPDHKDLQWQTGLPE